MKRWRAMILPGAALGLPALLAAGLPLPRSAAAATSVPAQVILPADGSVPGLSTRTSVRVDTAHPLRIGEEFYPEESKRLGEQGICVVHVEVTADGRIRAAQLTSSSGFERLNRACLAAFEDGRLVPATQSGRPVSSWVNIPIVWKLTGDRFPMTPQIRDDYVIEGATREYPPTSRQLHQEGSCVVHVVVSADGAPEEVRVSQSSGYDALDQASLRAIQQAPFVAARSADGSIITASTDIELNWRLP